jgi:monoamine oxidase
VLELVREIERLAMEIPLDAPWEAEGADRLDSVSCAEWLEAQAGPRALAELVPMAHRFMGDLTKISLLHALFYSRSNEGFGSFLGIGDKHDSLELRGSAHGLARRAAEALGDVVRYGVEVGRIVDDDGGVTVGTDEGRVTARRCVVACPPAAARAIAYEPEIDRERAELMARMELFSQVKAQILYPRPFWADQGLSGFAISPAIETMPSTIVPDGLAGLIAFSWRDEETSRLEALAPERRRAEVLAAIGQLLGDAAREPIGYVDRTWGDDRWSRGCVLRMPPGAWTGPGLAMRRPSGRIHWAGAETATVFCGQMEGALRSGKRAGEEILAAES